VAVIRGVCRFECRRPADPVLGRGVTLWDKDGHAMRGVLVIPLI
jgi:hypothetical protein